MLRLAFGILLLIASFDKIRHPYAFAEAVENYLVVGQDLSRWVAVWLPYVEALVGLGLILGIWLDAVSAMNALLMIIFLILVSQAYARGLDIRCGCFFVDGEAKIGLLKVLENLIYASFSIVLLDFVLKRERKSG
jgi:uncharacterized membrane protein YphA (DoxX/SURF4 family)